MKAINAIIVANNNKLILTKEAKVELEGGKLIAYAPNYSWNATKHEKSLEENQYPFRASQMSEDGEPKEFAWHKVGEVSEEKLKGFDAVTFVHGLYNEKVNYLLGYAEIFTFANNVDSIEKSFSEKEPAIKAIVDAKGLTKSLDKDEAAFIKRKSELTSKKEEIKKELEAEYRALRDELLKVVKSKKTVKTKIEAIYASKLADTTRLVIDVEELIKA